MRKCNEQANKVMGDIPGKTVLGPSSPGAGGGSKGGGGTLTKFLTKMSCGIKTTKLSIVAHLGGV